MSNWLNKSKVWKRSYVMIKEENRLAVVWKRSYVMIKEENRLAVVWKRVWKYIYSPNIMDKVKQMEVPDSCYGRYLDDPEYDLHVFYEDEFSKPKMSLKLLWLILKFRIYDWKERR